MAWPELKSWTLCYKWVEFVGLGLTVFVWVLRFSSASTKMNICNLQHGWEIEGPWVCQSYGHYVLPLLRKGNLLISLFIFINLFVLVIDGLMD